MFAGLSFLDLWDCVAWIMQIRFQVVHVARTSSICKRDHVAAEMFGLFCLIADTKFIGLASTIGWPDWLTGVKT